jgi:hypothetical protein
MLAFQLGWVWSHAQGLSVVGKIEIRFFERLDEEGNEVRFLHGRSRGLRVGGSLHREDHDASGAWRGPSPPKQFSKVPGRRTIFRRRSFRGTAGFGWGGEVRGSWSISWRRAAALTVILIFRGYWSYEVSIVQHFLGLKNRFQ